MASKADSSKKIDLSQINLSFGLKKLILYKIREKTWTKNVNFKFFLYPKLAP